MTEPTNIALRTQNPNGAAPLFKRIEELLCKDNLQRFRVAVAYARWDGLGLLAPSIEDFLGEGGEFQSIFGVANGVTTPDCLLYNLYLQQLYKRHTYAGAIEDEYSNSIFHPKLYEFRFATRTIVIIGSANLTGGGLLRNTELGVEVEADHGDAVEASIDAAWTTMKNAAQVVTLPLVRTLKKRHELADENHRGENQSKSTKPKLPASAHPKPRPLFSKVLELADPARKSKILSKFETITDRPERFYLQVLEYETGGRGDHPGYQIQLPSATLAAYFGVGEDEARPVTFHFPNEDVNVTLTHFANNTHRVRLRPLRDIQRPAVVIFRRVGEDEYQCSLVPSKLYAKTLSSKCSEQRREGARRWGLE
jgi:HKD family nuclease